MHPLRVALVTWALVAVPVALLADPRVDARPLPAQPAQPAQAAQAGQAAQPAHPAQPGHPAKPAKPGQPCRASAGHNCYPNNGNYYPYVYVNGDNYMTPSPHHTPTPHPKNQNNTQNGQQVFSSYSTGN